MNKNKQTIVDRISGILCGFYFFDGPLLASIWFFCSVTLFWLIYHAIAGRVDWDFMLSDVLLLAMLFIGFSKQTKSFWKKEK